MDYKNAGVDIEAGYKSVELMKEHVKKDHARGGFRRPRRIFRRIFRWQRSRRWRSLCCSPVPTACGTKVKLSHPHG